MFPQHIIARKRDGQKLTRDEIAAFVRGATDGSWADYQLSAMLMAIFLRGMDTGETATLTEAMMRSGFVADLANVRQPKADKHSTGGVGDKISLPLAPMVAACGVAVPMISGRGLGHTGGTLDKLESIPGFRVNLSMAEYRTQLERVGVALIGQTADLAPADKKLYALRDVTGTVESIPLICASILSKKLAEGTGVLVGDIKFGRGAFMKDLPRARQLARTLVSVSNALGTPMRALLTSMEQPLGRTVGNALEIVETIECLQGRGPADTMELTYALGGEMLLLAKVAKTRTEARTLLEESVSRGTALAKWRELVSAQGGDERVVDDPARLPQAKLKVELPAPRDGWVKGVDAMGVALATLRLGAGRSRAENPVDHAVGVSGLVKIGERVERGAALCLIHANDQAALAEAKKKLAEAIAVGPRRVKPPKLIGDLIA
ncbi:MAG TPA: thymidine phosphorylase [Opitutaceae bacterium]|nr:thymidine phosphorylase [Opitutaceae bacterium]